MTAPSELQQFEQDDWIASINFNPTKDLILCGYYDKSIRILDYSGNVVASHSFDNSVKSASWITNTKGVSGTIVINTQSTLLYVLEWKYLCMGT